MTAGDPLLARVWETLAAVAGRDRVSSGPSAACPLGRGGFWFDSIDLLDAILACEKAFDIAFEIDTDFDASRLRTVGDLVSLVRDRGGR